MEEFIKNRWHFIGVKKETDGCLEEIALARQSVERDRKSVV